MLVLPDIAGFFREPADPSLLVFGVYNPWLVTLSVLVAIFASGMALQVAGHAAQAARPILRLSALATGSLALGCGVWSMHFIGMLAFNLCTTVEYDEIITLLSMVPSIAASAVALSLISAPRIGSKQLIIGGVLVGAGIGAMHYSGMAAMRMAPVLSYDPLRFAISILVAVGLSILALWIRFGTTRLNIDRRVQLILSATVMGCAIAGMHYTGMSAARFSGRIDGVSGAAANLVFLALAVVMITVMLTIVVLSVNGYLRYRELYRELDIYQTEQRALLATAADGVIIIDGEGEIREFNPAAERIFGWPEAEVVGRDVRMLIVDPQHDRRGTSDLASYLASTQAAAIGRSRDLTGLRRDGARFPLRLSVGHAQVDGRDLFVGFVADMSERREMEEGLRQAKESAEQAAAARAAFLANMSHEIRTPMNAIIGFTDVLLTGELAAEQRRHLGTVRGAARSLLGLLNEVLDTAKLDKGTVELDEQDFDLFSLMDEVASTLGTPIQRKGLVFKLDIAPGMARAYRGDPGRLRQILTNLLGNAVKFTESGAIGMSVRSSDDKVQITVTDTGIGIASDRLTAIFDAFTQADATTSRRFGGTGLGLTISRKLAELMGGTLTASSEPGRGSEFRLVLPLVPAQMPVGKVRIEPRNHAVPPSTILVVDDLPNNVEVVTLQLGGQGHVLHVAANGADALALFRRLTFDLVLMDIHMPDMDGLEAARRMRAIEAEHHRPRVPIIALSASVLTEDRQAAANAGMDGFVPKPIDIDRLEQEMLRLLRERPLSPGMAKPDLDRQRIAGTATRLADLLSRGALDDALLGEFKAEIDGHVAPDVLGEFFRAIDDFDLALAHTRLQALAAELSS